MIEVISKFQILIAGTLGFLGVVITIIVNGYLARTQYSHVARTKADNVRTAITSELEINVFTYKARIEQLYKPHRFEGKLPSAVFSDVYDSLLNEIGLLKKAEIEVIIKAYACIKELPNIIKLYSSETHDDFIHVDTNSCIQVAKMHTERLVLINKAIILLKSA